MRYLLDSSAIEVSPERDSFLNLFYDEQMDALLSPFLQPDMWTEHGLLKKDQDKEREEEQAAKDALAAAVADNGGDGGGAGSQAHRDAMQEMAVVAARRRERKASWDCARKHVVELLSFSVEHHGHRIKYYMLRNNVMQAVTQLLSSEADKHLVLTALKFLRQVGTTCACAALPFLVLPTSCAPLPRVCAGCSSAPAPCFACGHLQSAQASGRRRAHGVGS